MNQPASLINDCFLHDKDRLSHDDALALLRERLTCVCDTEVISSKDALGRILAADISAPHNVPLHTNSAVDGYAFNHADLTPSPMPLSGRIAAGDLSPEALLKDHAARIFTGAAMPPNADTVAMQEDCKEHNGTVSLPQGLKAGANCRLAGEDLAQGDLVMSAGHRVGTADLAALASIGVAKVNVFKKLKAILFSNGNEMRAPDDGQGPLLAGQVYDANAPMLSALLSKLPIDLTFGGIIKDNEEDALAAIESASHSYDIILTTGGASRGDEDHMLSTLDKLGKRHLWQLAVKPGRPMMFGQIPREKHPNDCLFFGLPGNPVAASVCFTLYTRPALLQLCGAHWEEPVRYQIPSGFEIKNKKPDRREFLRANLLSDENGTLHAHKYLRDGSGLIGSLRDSEGLIEILESTTSLKMGELVNFIPFNSFD